MSRLDLRERDDARRLPPMTKRERKAAAKELQRLSAIWCKPTYPLAEREAARAAYRALHAEWMAAK